MTRWREYKENRFSRILSVFHDHLLSVRAHARKRWDNPTDGGLQKAEILGAKRTQAGVPVEKKPVDSKEGKAQTYQ